MQSESQSNRAPGPRGACREAPPAGWNGAGFLPDGAEGNPASRRSRALHNQNVSPFQLRLRAQQDLAPRIDMMIHVANVLSNKATNHWAIGPLGHWAVDMPSRLRRRNRGPGSRSHPVAGPRTRGRFLGPRPREAMRAAESVAPHRTLKALPQRSQSPSGSFHSQQNRRPP